jgi:hypothetical protein
MEIMKLASAKISRPDDQRYTSLEALHAAAVDLESLQVERKGVDVSTLSAVVDDGKVALVGKGGKVARLTRWTFGQLCARAGAPAGYLETLSADTAAKAINEGLLSRLASMGENAGVNLLIRLADVMTMHAITGTKYERIWNREITERLLNLKAQGWDVMKPDLNIGARFDDGQRPLYLSDHDMLAAVCSESHTVRESGNPDGLKRGIIVRNSTVGASTLEIMQFLFRGLCGNHIVWNAQEVIEINMRHVGNVRDGLSAWDSSITRYLESSATETEAKIESSKRKLIAASKDDVLDVLFGKRIPVFTRKALDASFDAVIPDVDGDAKSVWGFVQGVTRYSQTIPYGDDRTALDVAAGKLLTMF